MVYQKNLNVAIDDILKYSLRWVARAASLYYKASSLNTIDSVLNGLRINNRQHYYGAGSTFWFALRDSHSVKASANQMRPFLITFAKLQRIIIMVQ